MDKLTNKYLPGLVEGRWGQAQYTDVRMFEAQIDYISDYIRICQHWSSGVILCHRLVSLTQPSKG